MVEYQVGSLYKGGEKVVEIRAEVTDRGLNIRRRSLITLESGVIMIEDEFEAKVKIGEIEGDYVNHPYQSVDFPKAALDRIKIPKDRIKAPKSPSKTERRDAANKQQEIEQQIKEQLAEEEIARKESILKEARLLKVQAEKNRKAEDEERRRKTAEKNAKIREEEIEAAAATTRAEVEAKQREEEKKLKIDEAEAQRLVEEQSEGVVYIQRNKEEEARKTNPVAVWVYSDGDPDASEQDNPIAFWKTVDSFQDNDCWSKQEVLLYPNEHSPKNESSLLPSGIWVYAPGTVLGDNHPEWHPSCAWLYPPGEAPPTDAAPGGYWVYNPKSRNRKWPPSVDAVKKERRKVGRVKTPSIFQKGQPLSIPVYPQARKPRRPWERDKNRDELFGTWTYSEGMNQNDDDWSPQQILVFPPGATPPPQNDVISPRGVWTYSEGNDHDHDRPEFKVYTPDDEPVDYEHSQVRGEWTYLPDTDHSSWPPPTFAHQDKLREREIVSMFWPMGGFGDLEEGPVKAIVHPQTKLLESGTDQPVGVWAYGDGETEDEVEDWGAREVIMYPPGQQHSESDTPDSSPHGIWVISPEVDTDGDEDFVLKFYVLGQSPSDIDGLVNGVWKVESGNLDDDSSTSTPEQTEEQQSQALPGKLIFPDLGSGPFEKEQRSVGRLSISEATISPKSIPQGSTTWRNIIAPQSDEQNARSATLPGNFHQCQAQESLKKPKTKAPETPTHQKKSYRFMSSWHSPFDYEPKQKSPLGTMKRD